MIAHSEKEQAAPTFKRTFGFHPLGVWCDNTSEFLAAKLRTGRTGSNTAADHIEVLAAAIAQVPAAHREGVLIRSDGAGASHDLLDWLTAAGRVRGHTLEYSVGFALTEKIREAIAMVPSATWVCSIDADGGVRAGGDVAELTGLLDLEPLAHGHAGHRATGRSAPRRPAVPVRKGRRVALPSLRHQHTHRAAGVPGSPLPGPRPRGGPYPARQGLRHGTV